MVIAITGASGFIGRNVVNALKNKSNADLVLITRNPKKIELTDSQVTVTELDIAAQGSDAFNRIGKPDVLLHLAWDGLPNYNSLHHFEREISSQYQFIKSLVMDGLQSVVVTGTCFEYGMQSGRLSESMETVPGNPYGFAKDMLRKQLEFLKKSLSFKFTWARLFYMYGEGQPRTSLFSLLNKAVENGENSFDMSGGEQLRDYLPVSLVAEYLAILTLKCCDSGVVNVCSGEPVSVRTLVETWIKENNWNIKLNFGKYPYPDYEPMAFWGDNRKLVSLAASGSIP